MPRNRKPLAMQKGHLTVVQQEEKTQQEQLVTVGNEQLKKTPKWLIDNTAKAEYKRLVKEFEKIEVVGNLDLNNIVCYCNAYSNYRKATAELAGEPLVIEKTLPNGSSVMAENPLIKIQKIYAEEMRKFATTVGLTIDSRLKTACFQTSKENEAIIDDFGDF